VDVRRYAGQKQAALAAHRTQAGGSSSSSRVLSLLVRMPTPVFRLLLGRERFRYPCG
jgi:hypothetical protein